MKHLFMKCLHKTFEKETHEALDQSRACNASHKEKIDQLPKIIDTFYEKTRLNTISDAVHLKMYCPQASFRMDQKGPQLKIDYTEEVFAHSTRLAFIDSKMHGISFQGLDRYVSGKGSMTGILARFIKLFHVTGSEMDQSALVTWLCEAILLPKSMAICQIEWSGESENMITARIKRGQYIVSVTFYFDKEGLLTKAETKDRFMTIGNKEFKQEAWCIAFDNYQWQEGLLLPMSVQSSWLLDAEEFVYFKSDQAVFSYEI